MKGLNPGSASRQPTFRSSVLNWKGALVWLVLAVAAFHLAYASAALSFVIVVFLLGLIQLSRLGTGRRAFYGGLIVGLAVYVPHLRFFWTIFGSAAMALWLVLAFWVGLFVGLARLCRSRFGAVGAALLIPFLWTGLEYFRSELYYLRFSWLNVGYVFAGHPQWLPLHWLGMYGVGFVFAAFAGVLVFLPLKRAWIPCVPTIVAIVALNFSRSSVPARGQVTQRSLKVAGVQLEFASDAEKLRHLDALVQTHPQAELLVLSEYTFQDPVPDTIKAWCRKNHRFLLLGAEDPAGERQYFNTAFVIGPDGQDVFRQAKSVPIQFFKDGLPAQDQRVWDSPWGKLGICICYDLSYRRVTDRLIRQGAQALLVPTMDAADWGRSQHELHTRVAPIRAAEYGVPIFRLASSGISQLVDGDGSVTATAPFPGDGAMIAGELPLANGRVPLDRALGPIAVGITAILIIVFAVSYYLSAGWKGILLPRRLSETPSPNQSAQCSATRLSDPTGKELT